MSYSFDRAGGEKRIYEFATIDSVTMQAYTDNLTYRIDKHTVGSPVGPLPE
jgi:hypothetical protein